MLCNFLSAYSFSVNGDKTNQFILGRRVKFLYQDSGITYSTIDSSTFTGTTTEVIIRDPVLNSNVDQVLYGIVSTSPYGSLPDHGHSVDPGDGGLITISGTSGAVSFLELLDTPSYFDDGKFLISTSSGIGYTTITVTSGIDGVDGVDGEPGPKGDKGDDGFGMDGTLWYAGTDEVPSNVLGNAYDFYINPNSNDIFRKDNPTYGSNLFVGGTPTASSENSSNFSASKAVDGSLLSYWFAATWAPQWWKYDFGLGNEKAVTKIIVYPRRDGGDRNFKGYSIHGSHDDVVWTLLDSGEIPNAGTNTPENLEFNNTIPYRYIRVSISSTYANYPGMLEIYAYDISAVAWDLFTNIKGDKGDVGPVGDAGDDAPTTFSGLTDTPNYYDDGKFLVSTQSGIGYTIVPTISGLDGTDGVDGAPGVDGIDGTTWYSGTDDPPGQELGVENDFYFNSNTYDIFKKDYLTFSTVNVFTGGTATAEDYSGGYPPASAVDDNTLTKWYRSTPSTSWWKYDLGSGNNKTVSKIDMYVIDGVRDFDIGASNDDSLWITLHTDIITSSTEQWHSFTFDNVDSYRYYRVFIYNSNNSNVRSINEIKAYEQMGYDWSLVANVKGDDGVDGINAPDSFVELVDTPSYYDDGKFLVSTNSGIDFVSLTDFSTASGTSFTTISGMNSVNVQDAIEELYNMILALI